MTPPMAIILSCRSLSPFFKLGVALMAQILRLREPRSAIARPPAASRLEPSAVAALAIPMLKYNGYITAVAWITGDVQGCPGFDR